MKRSFPPLPLLLSLCLGIALSAPYAHADLAQDIRRSEQKIEQLEKLEATPVNKQLKEITQQILSIQQEQAGFIDKAKNLGQQLKEHAARLAELKQSLQEISAVQPEADFAGKPLHDLERLQEAWMAEKLTLQNQLEDTQNKLAQLQARLLPAQAELSAAKKELEQASKDSKTPTVALEPELANALLLKKRVALDAKTAQIQALEVELLGIPNQLEMAGVKKAWLAQKLKNLGLAQDKLQSQLQIMRQAESADILDKSKKLLANGGEDPALAWLAEDNVALGNQLAEYAETSQEIADKRAALGQLSKLLEQRYALLKQQLDLGGETAETGELMRQTLIQLKSLGKESTDATIIEIQQAQIQSLNYERSKTEAQERALFVQTVVARFPQSQLSIVNQDTRERLNSLLDLRLDLIGKLLERNQQALKSLSLLLNDQNQFNDQAAQFSKLLMENLLWTATNRPIGLVSLADLSAGVDWLTSAEVWRGLSARLWERRTALIGWGLGYGLLRLLLRGYLRPRFRTWQAQANAAVGNVREDLFRNTLLMLAFEFLQALPTPLLLLALRKIIVRSHSEDVWNRLLGDGLLGLALGSVCLGFACQLTQPGGFLQGQLRWPAGVLAALQRELRYRWLLAALPTYVYVVEVEANLQQRYEFGRLPFLVFCLWAAFILRRLTRAWVATLEGERGPLWHVSESPRLLGQVFMLGELYFAGMELFGFHLGAFVLQGTLLKTLGWTFVIAIGYQILERWLLLEEHRMAYAHAVEIRAERRASSEEDGIDETSQQKAQRQQFVEIQTISLQSKTLLQLLSGAAFVLMLGWVWADLVPALHMLDQVVVWEVAKTGGVGADVSVVTLKSLVLAVLLAGLMVLAMRSLPGMLQLLVLQHLKLAAGTDFALTTVLRYAIFTAGVVAVCHLLGLQWNDLQWLVAALSVGLGFGLQEIFANFVSGLIILFEKPIRIGDVVTLNNGVTGTIDAINTRSTTLTNWDNKEIIVPNKSLITEQLTNWSLTSKVIRVVVPIGVAYGSDTDLVHRLLAQAADEHPLVLAKPERGVFFRAFGASSLDFELRCFVASPSLSLSVTHDLNMRIDKLFREQGVEIAFPQVDVHIRDGGEPLN
ncbi:MAG: mechanosensitive ion channel domain-containing protein [Candidatus Methylumidiphilus sp.]